MDAPRMVIVGAGPAGIRAAEALVAVGHRPVLLDEAERGGGQIYRRPPHALLRNPRKLYGFEAARAAAVHAAIDGLAHRIDYRPKTAVWNASGGRLDILSDEGPGTVLWDRLIVAAGAMDRVVPFEGWTLPGVFTLGGAQIALKAQACAVGRRPVFVGTGPLLYLVAWQYARAGVRPAAVLDTAPPGAGMRAVGGLAMGGTNFLKGLVYLAELRLRGIPVRSGIAPERVEAGEDGAVETLVWRDAAGSAHRTPCDAVGCGFGLRSETQLLDLLGADFVFEAQQRQWLPAQDADGRASVPGIYVAGDGGGIRGAQAAEVSGERAALALLHDLGVRGYAGRLAKLGRRLARFNRFRAALETAFPFPVELTRSAPDDLMICRCEGITAGALRLVADEAAELNRAKALTRVGMGRCQGRVCGAAAAEILAGCRMTPVAEVGRLRTQAPLKPLPIAALVERPAP